ncbi:MAG: hypothetical protein OEV44_13515, partial [Spirochaetota bacterium]|nr:hypothetical protein [Spirochaetota bacterium]
MKDEEKILAYHSKQFEGINLRASQKAILDLAEKSVEKGEFDTSIDLYSKILSQPNLKRTIKVKIEKNISN